MKFIIAIVALFAGSSMAARVCTDGKPQCCSLDLLGKIGGKLDCKAREFSLLLLLLLPALHLQSHLRNFHSSKG
jgi:hypothetical protein